jgi:pyridoxine 5-phosphate synthase
VKLNLEMAAESAITQIAVEVHPEQCTLVPERREEITTEGGLDVVGNLERVRDCVQELQQAGIIVSLFIDAERDQIDAAKSVGAEAVELHTGRYADAPTPGEQDREYETLVKAAAYAKEAALDLHLGHGLTYRNVSRVAAISGVGELNIGHSIVARAVMVGFEQAVREMKTLVNVPGYSVSNGP